MGVVLVQMTLVLVQMGVVQLGVIQLGVVQLGVVQTGVDLKKGKRDQGKRKRAAVTPNQTKLLLEPKKYRKTKGKEEDKESIGAKKEKINGA